MRLTRVAANLLVGSEKTLFWQCDMIFLRTSLLVGSYKALFWQRFLARKLLENPLESGESMGSESEVKYAFWRTLPTREDLEVEAGISKNVRSDVEGFEDCWMLLETGDEFEAFRVEVPGIPNVLLETIGLAGNSGGTGVDDGLSLRERPKGGARGEDNQGGGGVVLSAGDFRTTTNGRTGRLQEQDRSAVTHPSSSHARRCLIRLSCDNSCTRYTTLS
ncbi:hypothetical protein J6590_095216 [Homalodisca vitripennis]|nr:hypothetical protein J6590_095216 [Homalodisca vitripennis]